MFPNLLFIHYGFAASLNCVNDISIAQERVSLLESTFFGLTDSQVPSTTFTAFFLARQNRVPRHAAFLCAAISQVSNTPTISLISQSRSVIIAAIAGVARGGSNRDSVDLCGEVSGNPRHYLDHARAL